MTRREIQRAVADVLAQEMPSMMDALAERLVSKLAPHLAPLFVVQQGQPPLTLDAGAELTAHSRQALEAANSHPGTWLAMADLPAPAATPEPTPAPAATGPWTVGEGSRRRLTEAGLARLAELLPEKTDTQIAAELGITRRAVETRRKTGTESTAAWAATPQPERDLARAEKARAYQREWLRKRRAKGDAPSEAEPVVIGADLGSMPAVQVDVPLIVADAQTVAVVPAAEVPALIVPPAPLNFALPTPAAPAKLILPPAPPKPKAAPEIITTTPKEVRAWLIGSMKAGGLSLVQAQDRVGFMTHEQALAEANQRRIRAGYPPFAFIGARTAA